MSVRSQQVMASLSNTSGDRTWIFRWKADAMTVVVPVHFVPYHQQLQYALYGLNKSWSSTRKNVNHLRHLRRNWKCKLMYFLFHEINQAGPGLNMSAVWTAVLPNTSPICSWYDMTSQQSGPRPKIKTVFPKYGDSHVKDKTVAETVLSLTWESLYW